MELLYSVRGADGKDYGPVTLDQLRGWIAEGRLRADGDVRRSDMNYWAAAGTFEELKPFFLTTLNQPLPGAAPIAARNPSAASPLKFAHLKSGASWFYWIAALSLVNSVAAFAGVAWRFILGLGVTQFIDALGAQLHGPTALITLGLNVLVTGIFVLFGFFAAKGHLWAFILGIICFLLDGLIFLLAQDWLGVGFHAFILFFLIRGANAARSMGKADG